MGEIYVILGIIGSIASIFGFLGWIVDRLLPKPKLRFNPGLKLIEITNNTEKTIYIIGVWGKGGKVSDYSLEGLAAMDGPNWLSKYSTDYAIYPGTCEDICFRFNGGYDFKMRVKRASFFHPNKFIIILSRK